MLPGLADGDYVVVWRGARAKPGRVVALRDPRFPERVVVKRVSRRVAEGWWVLGDNPAASTDSRQFGPVPDYLVVGRVLFRYWRR